MAGEVRDALLQRLDVLLAEIFLGHAAMHLERAHGGDDHDGARLQAGLAALDVEELLGPEIGAEAGLGHHVLAELEGGAGRDRGVAAVGDVGERAAMDEGRVVLERLHEVRHDGVLQQDGHGTVGLEVAGVDGLAVAGVGDDDVAEAAREILQVGGEAEDRHHLGGDGDVEAVLAREAVGDAAERRHDAAQRPVVHVHDAAPGDAALVDAELVAPVEVVVDEGGEQVVGGADGVEIAGEVEVDVLHRHDLGVAAAGRPALHAEAGAEAGLAQADHGLLADAVEAVAEADGRGGLALARRRRRDGGDQDELAVGPFLQAVDEIEGDLRLARAVAVEVLFLDADPGGHLLDRQHLRRPRNLDIASDFLGHVSRSLSSPCGDAM